jgi:hypothetical protein
VDSVTTVIDDKERANERTKGTRAADREERWGERKTGDFTHSESLTQTLCVIRIVGTSVTVKDCQANSLFCLQEREREKILSANQIVLSSPYSLFLPRIQLPTQLFSNRTQTLLILAFFSRMQPLQYIGTSLTRERTKSLLVKFVPLTASHKQFVWE